MPHPRDVEKYPEAMRNLIREAATREIVIPNESRKEALSLRGRIYSFISALEKANTRADASPETRELAAFAKKVQVKINDETFEMKVRPRDMDPVNDKILGALATASTGGASSSIPQPSAGLLELIKEGGEKKDGE